MDQTLFDFIFFKFLSFKINFFVKSGEDSFINRVIFRLERSELNFLFIGATKYFRHYLSFLSLLSVVWMAVKERNY